EGRRSRWDMRGGGVWAGRPGPYAATMRTGFAGHSAAAAGANRAAIIAAITADLRSIPENPLLNISRSYKIRRGRLHCRYRQQPKGGDPVSYRQSPREGTERPHFKGFLSR